MNNPKKHIVFSLAAILTFINTFSQEPTDCVNSVTICGNSNLNFNVNGIGTQELSPLNNSCSAQENNSIWLKVTVTTNGTLGFTLTPNSSNISEDYDFFVFGPNVPCNNLGQAIRCSTTNPAQANLSSNLTGMNGSETETSEGPGPSGNSFVKWLDVNAGETYYIAIDRPLGMSPFSLEWTGTAEFSEPPVNQVTSGTALNLETCDTLSPFEDGLSSFDLEVNSAPVIGGQTNMTVTYYENESDANLATNEIVGPYTNTSNPQTIYFRITDNATECYTLGEFNLNVNLGPAFNQPNNLELCDTQDDGDPMNGLTVFDLEMLTADITNGFSDQNLNISYHETLSDAEIGANALPQQFYNTTPNTQELFIRIEDPFNPDCRAITTSTLIVNPSPIANQTTLIQCDEDGIPEGFTTFNLTEIETEITEGAINSTVAFYLSQEDALADIPINANEFQNFQNPQIIFVTVTDNQTGCTSSTTLTLEASTTGANNAILEACDDDGSEDGFYTFTLSEASDTVLSNLPDNLDMTYYETYEAALLETNPLPDSYTNTTPNTQTIFARVENSNACYGISEVELKVHHLPNIETEAEANYCVNLSPETLTLTGGVIDDIPNNYYYNWSTGETTTTIEVDTPGTYTVRVTNTLGCYKDRTITVLPSNAATIESVEVVDASENNLITVFVSGDGAYEYALDAIDGPYQDSPTFTNVEAGLYTVYVRSKHDCGITEKMVSVIGFPKFFTPNGDGHNDFWQVTGLSQQMQFNSTIYIFNQYGKIIKELSPRSAGWDGTLNGKPLPSSDYWFSVTLGDGRNFTSHFALKR